MTTKRYSPEYIQHLKQAPFPGRIDPWAEIGRYFHPVHSEIISNLITQIQDPLLEIGYMAGRETSLEIIGNRQPDVLVEHKEHRTELSPRWDYESAAVAVLLEPGTAVLTEETELEAVHITDFETGDLVTVIEVVSPSNKTHIQDIWWYRQQRTQLFLNHEVNVVEIDATRSIKRLLDHPLTNDHAYHVAIYIPGDLPRVLTNDFNQPLKKLALPLRAEVFPVDLQDAYDRGYQRLAMAGKIQKEKHYSENDLPFPSLLTEAQRQEALAAVAAWQAELERLRTEA